MYTPELLEKTLRSKRKRCMIGTGSMRDPYWHCEKKSGLTRKCLEIINRYGFGATMITKSNRFLCDLALSHSKGDHPLQAITLEHDWSPLHRLRAVI